MEKFKKKEAAINKAIDRVKKRLKELEEYSNSFIGVRYESEEYKERTKWWNHYHDLQYRLEERLWANWSAYKDWHWEKYGFNTY
jgi:HD superfamily phosphodiesterase